MIKLKTAKRLFLRGINLGLHDPYRLINHLKLRFAIMFCALLKGYAPWPNFVHITINNRCNLRCKTCDMGQAQLDSPLYKSMSAQSELGLEQWKIVIDKIAFFHPEVVIDTVEPLLYKDIIGFLKFARREKKLPCTLTTNGFYLEKYAAELADLDLERVNVSIDGIPQIHDQIRGLEGSFSRAIAGVKKLISYSRHPKLGIHYTISNFNYRYLKQTIDYLSNLIEWDSFLFIHLSFVSPDMASRHNLRFPDNPITSMDFSGTDLKEIEISQLCEQINQVKKAYGQKEVNFHPDLSENQLFDYYRNSDIISKDSRCRVPWICSNILSNADVIPLNRCGQNSYGNLLKMDFAQIWNGQNYRKFRLLLNREKAFPICLRCGGLKTGGALFHYKKVNYSK